MPGYVIHLAIAEEYSKKHIIQDYEEFIEGVIFPDSVKDKSETHYGPKSSKSNLYDFLKENNIDTSFKKGYFLHLLTDYLFYNKYIHVISNDIYNDYDILNKKLIEKYNVKIPSKIKNQVFFKEGELVILSLEIIDKLIFEISNMELNEIAKKVEKEPKKWTKMQELKRL